jgi:hypothetical protein
MAAQMSAYLSVLRHQEKVSPDREESLQWRNEGLGVADNPQIRLEQHESVSIEQRIRSTSKPPSHRIALLLVGRRACRRTDKSDVVIKDRHELLWRLVRPGGSPPLQCVCVYGIVPRHNNLPSCLVERHALGIAACIFHGLWRVTLALLRYVELEYSGSRRDEQRRHLRFCVGDHFDTRDWVFGLVHDALLRPQVVDEIAADDGHGAVGEADRDLR